MHFIKAGQNTVLLVGEDIKGQFHCVTDTTEGTALYSHGCLLSQVQELASKITLSLGESEASVCHRENK